MADLELRTSTELDGTAGNELAGDNILPITRAAAGSGLFRTKLSTLKAWLLGNGILGQVFTMTAGGPAWADPTGGGGGGGLIDAPSDGSTYGRRNGAWSPVTSGGGGGEGLYDLSAGVPVAPLHIGDTANFTWSENPGKGLNVKKGPNVLSVPNCAGWGVPREPGAAWHYAVLLFQNNYGAIYYGEQVGIYDSVSGKLVTGLSLQGGYIGLAINTWNSYNNRANNTNISVDAAQSARWLHVKDDGSGNISFGVSQDGATPVWFVTTTVGAFIGTYTHVFFGGFFDTTNNVDGASVSVLCVDPKGSDRVVGGGGGAGDGGGGGGGSAPWYFDPPLVADFPVSIGAVDITTGDDADVGMIIETDGPFSYCRAIGQAVTATGDFQVTMRSEFFLLNDHYANFGIALWNGVSPKVLLFSFDGRSGNPTGHLFRLNATAFDGYEDFIPVSGAAPQWLRVRYNATTGLLQSYMSADGKVWVATASHNMLTDFGAPTFCGIGIAADSYPHHLGLSIQYFKVE